MNIFDIQSKIDACLKIGRCNAKNKGRANSLKGLYDLITENLSRDSKVIEIGSFAGVSTKLFAITCREVISVDCWGDTADKTKDYIDSPTICDGKKLGLNSLNADDYSLEEALAMFKETVEECGNIKSIVGMSHEVAASDVVADKWADIVYIDGNHNRFETKRDLLSWYPKVKHGGFISGHGMDSTGVKIAIKEACQEWGISDSIRTYVDSSYILNKP
jgi:hypothetical protein